MSVHVQNDPASLVLPCAGILVQASALWHDIDQLISTNRAHGSLRDVLLEMRDDLMGHITDLMARCKVDSDEGG